MLYKTRIANEVLYKMRIANEVFYGRKLLNAHRFECTYMGCFLEAQIELFCQTVFGEGVCDVDEVVGNTLCVGRER